MILAFTGHRPDKLGGYGSVNPLRDQIMLQVRGALIRYGFGSNDQAISGMALGFDQWAANACVGLHIPFTAAVPFVGQEASWPVDAQARYRELLGKAKKVEIVSSGGYAALKMQRRNEWMVDRCDMLLAVWDGSPGGTANCIAYARAKKKPITTIHIRNGQVDQLMPVTYTNYLYGPDDRPKTH